MSDLSASDYMARAAACERCVALLKERPGEAAEKWLANKLRTEAELLRQRAQSAATPTRQDAQSQLFVPAPRNIGRPLTERMAQALDDLKQGAEIVSEEFFSWPRWESLPRSSRGCPTCAMLQGLNDRGLLSVSKSGRAWSIKINATGVDALADYERANKEKKPSIFKRFRFSFCIKQLDGVRTCLSDPVVARTENEGLEKLKKELARRNTGYEYSDFRLDWVGPNT